MEHSRSFSIDDVVVGHSPRMRAVFDFVRVVADSDTEAILADTALLEAHGLEVS